MKLEYTPEQINDTQRNKKERRIMFINQILLMSSAVFGLLAGLHSDTSSQHNHLAFAMSLLSLLLGILLLSIGLFGYVKIQDEETRQILVQASRQYDNMTPSPAIVSSEIAKLNRLCERISYYVLIFSLFSLTWYALTL